MDGAPPAVRAELELPLVAEFPEPRKAVVLACCSIKHCLINIILG